jgi:hypothetical protein
MLVDVFAADIAKTKPTSLFINDRDSYWFLTFGEMQKEVVLQSPNAGFFQRIEEALTDGPFGLRTRSSMEELKGLRRHGSRSRHPMPGR